MEQGFAARLDSRPGFGDSVLRRMGDLVRDLESQAGSDFNLGSTLHELTSSAAQLLPGAAHAGITVCKSVRDVQTVAATDRYPVLLDDIQRSYNEGPCLAAARRQHLVRVDDLTVEDRWPRYAGEAVAATPIRSVMSYPLFAHRPSSASLNFYSQQANSFGEQAAELGLVFAAYITLTWNILSRDQQFRKGLSSRDTIGQAKGMLMERFHIDAEAAFELLKQRSQETNTPVIEIACRLTDLNEPAFWEWA